jgi:hydroxymethylpyrimidine pyrophosphatase-like HAD family hydrolase
MRRIVFVDLDDTLFQSQRKNPDADRLAAVDREGNPLSFRSARQEAFLDWLARDALIVPVTGRSVDAFQRVRLPLGGAAICSFGGVILGSDGQPETEWHQRMTDAAREMADLMETLLGVVATTAAADLRDVRYRIIRDAGLPLYISVKHNSHDAEEVARLATAVSPSVPKDWVIHLNANNMALLPPFLGKAAAVAYFLERFVDGEGGAGPVLTLGVGDSLTDLGFMGLCDFAVTPSNSQIMSALPWQTPIDMLAERGRT